MNRINASAPLARYEAATGAVIESGNIVALDASGKAVPAADTAGLTVVGVARRVIDGEVEVLDGIFALANDTSKPLTRAKRGSAAYVKDAGTVAVSGTNSIAAGIVVDVYDDEVYVDMTPAALAAAK